MSRMRVVLGVVAGAVAWAILWVGGTLTAGTVWPELMAPGQPVDHAGALAGLVAWSVVLSLLAGYVTARAARGAQRPVLYLAVLQLVLGIVIEASAWSLTPVWYHLVFLVLLVPATVQGGRLAAPANAMSISAVPVRR